jgi:hypothetical protein
LTRSVPTNQLTRLVVPKDARALHTLRGTVTAANGVEPADLQAFLMRMPGGPSLRPSAQTQTTVDAAVARVHVPCGAGRTYHLMIGLPRKPMALRTDVQVGANDVDLGEIELGVGGLDVQFARSDGRPVLEPALGMDVGGVFGLAPANARERPRAARAAGGDVSPARVGARPSSRDRARDRAGRRTHRDPRHAEPRDRDEPRVHRSSCAARNLRDHHAAHAMARCCSPCSPTSRSRSYGASLAATTGSSSTMATAPAAPPTSA